MPGRELHEALRRLAAEVGELLTAELEGGAELPFEVIEQGTRMSPVLYRYRPLTVDFIAERWSRVRELESYAPAAALLAPGAGTYLRHRGYHGADPDDARCGTWSSGCSRTPPASRFPRSCSSGSARSSTPRSRGARSSRPWPRRFTAFGYHRRGWSSPTDWRSRGAPVSLRHHQAPSRAGWVPPRAPRWATTTSGRTTTAIHSTSSAYWSASLHPRPTCRSTRRARSSGACSRHSGCAAPAGRRSVRSPGPGPEAERGTRSRSVCPRAPDPSPGSS